MGTKAILVTLLSASFIGTTLCLPDPRVARVFSPLNVVQFPNDPCPGSGSNNGTCYTQAECSSRMGEASGSCAGGYGVCCVFVGGCGTEVRENSTYFQGDSTTAGSCSYRVCRASNNVCKIRLDFEMFSINGPDTNSLSAFKTVNGNTISDAGSGKGSSLASNCLLDSFMATNANGMAANVLCGDNSGQHMYINAQEGCAKLMFQFSGEGMRMWKIKVTQIGCQSEVLPPDGCIQYIFDVSGMGDVQTFNFAGGQHLANQDQNICIRREATNCRLCFSAIADEFSVSGPGDAPAGATNDCCGYGEDGMGDSGMDCVVIPGAKQNDGMTASPKICGRDVGLVAEDGGVTATVCTTTIPFSVRFLSDGFEFAGAADLEAGKQNKGFKLSYVQDTMMCV